MSMKKMFDNLFHGVPIVRSQYKLEIDDIKNRFHIKGETKTVVISGDKKYIFIECEK